MKRFLVINGPNINMLGIREPDVYGRQSYAYLLETIADWAEKNGCLVDCRQSNHEGDIVSFVQSAYKRYDGIVINPAAYTHTSVAILDALKAVGLPAVEVHISDVNARESFRAFSYASLYCFEKVVGRGLQGYLDALEILNRQ